MERKRKLAQTVFIKKEVRPLKRASIQQAAQVVQAMDVIQKTRSRSSPLLGLVPEKKYFDTAVTFQFDATGEVPASGQLALIPQGDTSTSRDGRQCVIESIQFRGYMNYVPGASATASDLAYLYIVWDKQANGAAAAVTDVFTTTAMYSNMLNVENSQRFIILKKFVVPFRPGAGVTTAYNNTVQPLEFFKKLNITMDFGTAAVDITQVRTNNLFLIAGSVTSDDLISFTGTCRLRFRG